MSCPLVLFTCLASSLISLSETACLEELEALYTSGSAAALDAESVVFLPTPQNVKIGTDRPTVLSVLLCDCETWSVILRSEEHRPRALRDEAAEEDIGRQGEEMTGNWRKLHSQELHDLYCRPDTFRAIK
jgi:hypothetical protein